VRYMVLVLVAFVYFLWSFARSDETLTGQSFVSRIAEAILSHGNLRGESFDQRLQGRLVLIFLERDGRTILAWSTKNG
jgi:hypothetical protein